MKPNEIVPGKFYYNSKCHYVYIGDSNCNLISLENGAAALPPDNEKVKSNFWAFFREALNDEIIRVLNKNVNFRRTSLNQVITHNGIKSRCCQVAVKPESIRTKNYKCSNCDNSCGIR